jgi:hypothetical protein
MPVKPIDPVRGPYTAPRSGKLAPDLIPKPYEVVVLRSRSGKMMQLRRGDPPTFGHRLVGGFTEMYFVDAGRHVRTFTAQLPTADIGIDLAAEIDAELTVEDCCEVVRERRGDLAEQLANWCQQTAAAVTSRFSAGGGDGADDLAGLGRQVTEKLQSAIKPEMFGMSLRELRVRLRFANESVVAEQGAAALTSVLRARSMERIQKIYEPIFGPEFSQIYSALVDQHEDQIPVFLARLQAGQQATQQTTQEAQWKLLTTLLNDSSIESHFRERLAMQLGKTLLGGDSANNDLAASLLSHVSELEAPREARAGDDDNE